MTVTTVSNLDERGSFSSPSKLLLYLDRFLTLSLDGSDAIVYGKNADICLSLLACPPTLSGYCIWWGGRGERSFLYRSQIFQITFLL